MKKALALVLLLNTGAMAAVSITSVSGQMIANSTITIFGSGFGTKAQAKPLVYDDYENGNGTLSSLGIRQAYDSAGLVGVSTTNCYDGNFCAESMAGWLTSSQGMFLQINWGLKYGDKFYFHEKQRTDAANCSGASDSENRKTPFRAWNTTVGGGHNDIIVGVRHTSGSTEVSCENGSQSTGVTRLFTSAPLACPDTAWRTVELIGRQNSATGVADGYLAVFINNVGVLEFKNWMMDQSGTLTGPYNILRIQDVFANNSGGHWQSTGNTWIDNLLVDVGGWQHVMVCDSPAPTATSVCEPQPTSAWSDGSVSFRYKPGRLAGPSNYIFVFDASNVKNQIGFKVGGVDTLAPAAPI